MKRTVALLVCCLPLAGCAVHPSDSTTGCHPSAVPYAFTIGPASVQALEPDHTAAPPGNQEQFQATVAPDPGPGCPVPQWVLNVSNATWSVSDKLNVTISNASATNGLATCVGATDGPATVSAAVTYDGFALSNTSTITCK